MTEWSSPWYCKNLYQTYFLFVKYKISSKSIEISIIYFYLIYSLIGPVGIGLLIKYKSERGATILQKITTPFTVFVLLFNLTVCCFVYITPNYFQINNWIASDDSKNFVILVIGGYICLLDLFCFNEWFDGSCRFSYSFLWFWIWCFICLGI